MQINISTRHGHLSDATRAKVSAKLDKLSRVFERVTSIDITIDLAHREQPIVDVRVNAEHKHDFVATDQSDDLMGAIDQVLHKLEQQLRRYKERIQEHRPNPKQEGISAQPGVGPT